MKRYFLSIADQGMASALMLGLNIVLARYSPPEQFGAFVFWSNTGLILGSLQNALTVCHIAVLPPGPGDAKERFATERLMLHVSLIYQIVMALGGGAVAVALALGGSSLGLLSAFLFLPAFLLQQYLRSLAFSRGLATAAAINTATVFFASLIGVAVLLMLGLHIDADRVLLVVAGGYWLSCLIGWGQLRPGFPRLFSFGQLKGYRLFVRDSRWVFVGVTSTELLVRFYSFVVATWFGPAALAALSASQLPLRPIPLLAVSWSSIGRADLAALREGNGWRKYGWHLLIAALVIIAIAIPYGLAVYFCWPLISHYVFAGKYADGASLSLLWAISSGLAAIQLIGGIGLQVVRAFRPLAIATAIAAAVTVLATLVLIGQFGYPASVIGTIIGQFVEIAIMTGLLTRFLATRAMARAAAGPA
ncbi:MAG: hypothetical protein PW790_10155 [Parvibaculaceae bacterium]|nr:hypothetical protein [Parvibaculaceae bacterium]